MECDATAWLVDFPNPCSHRQLGRNPFAQHQNYPKIDSSTKDYPKTTLTFFAFCRTVRKCVKALSENYPTKWCTFFMTIRNAKITIRKFFRPATLARDNTSVGSVFLSGCGSAESKITFKTCTIINRNVWPSAWGYNFGLIGPVSRILR